MQYMMDVCAACSCMREVGCAGRVVRWNNRKCIYIAGAGRASPTFMPACCQSKHILISPLLSPADRERITTHASIQKG